MRGELLQLAFESGEAIPGTPAVDLELCLAGSPSADAAGESRQRDFGALREPREQVLELCQLHLQLAVARGRMLREDVEDELRAVYHPQLHALAQVPRLRRGQVLVDDHEIDVALEGADDELVQLAGAEHGLGVDPGSVLRYDIDDDDPRRVGQIAKLGDMDLKVRGATAGGDRDQDRVLAVCDALRTGAARERGLAVADPVLEVEGDPRRRLRVEAFDAGVAVARGAVAGGCEDCGMCKRGQAVVVHAHRHDGVEAQQQQVGPVVARQPLVPKMGVAAAQAAQTPAAGPQAAPVGQGNRVGIAHHHVLDQPAAIEQHADLAPNLVADFGQVPGELLGDQPIGRHPTPEEALELASLTGLEAVRITEDLDGKCLQSRARAGGVLVFLGEAPPRRTASIAVTSLRGLPLSRLDRWRPTESDRQLYVDWVMTGPASTETGNDQGPAFPCGGIRTEHHASLASRGDSFSVPVSAVGDEDSELRPCTYAATRFLGKHQRDVPPRARAGLSHVDTGRRRALG